MPVQILDAMNQDSGIPLTQLQVDGGMTSNRLLMQLQADILCIPVGEVSFRFLFQCLNMYGVEATLLHTTLCWNIDVLIFVLFQ